MDAAWQFLTSGGVGALEALATWCTRDTLARVLIAADIWLRHRDCNSLLKMAGYQPATEAQLWAIRALLRVRTEDLHSALWHERLGTLAGAY